MRGKSRFLIPLLMVMVSLACKNNGNSPEKTSAEKGNSNMVKSNHDWTETAIASPLSTILPSCAQSKSYSRDIWSGKNSCSWALEKELLNKLPEYVKRNDSGLSFQTDQGSWRLLSGNSESNYILLNAYIRDAHIFILKNYIQSDCPEYWLYDPKIDHSTIYKGDFYLSPDQRHFAVIPPSACRAPNVVGRFSKLKGAITKEFSENTKVKSLKWSAKRLAFAANAEDFKSSIELP